MVGEIITASETPLAAGVLSDPVRGTPYRGRHDLIVVDEFQDTNPAQMHFVELLAGGDLSRVVVVGDDLQSIYAFTGAEIGFKIPDFSNFDTEDPEVSEIWEEPRFDVPVLGLRD